MNPFALLHAESAAKNQTDSSRVDARFRLEDATAELFRPHIGAEFAIHTADGVGRRLTLAKVTEQPLHRNIEQFSLIFRESAEEGLPDGTYFLRHIALGGFHLFIVPIGAPLERCTAYQACFSRVRLREAQVHAV